MSATPPEPAPDGLWIRPLYRTDLDALLEIEQASFSTPWRRATFEGLLDRTDTDLVAATAAGRLVGYAICWTVLDQAELGNLAVAPEWRGRGAGRVLLHAAMERVRRRGARECFLEVRVSNLAAQALYLRHGFEEVGRRRRYYARPIEDALVMRLDLD